MAKSHPTPTKLSNLSVYISVDMEGVAGVVAPADVWEPGGEFERARYWLTGEVNAAVQASFDSGAQNVLVNDAHMYMRNIIANELDERAQLIRGARKPGFMMQGIESEKFDLALFVGYHSMAGTQDGVLCHTFSDQWAGLYVNDKRIGEATYNAFYAAEYGCPIGMVSGDASISTELRDNLPWVEHAIVKEGIGRFAAKSLSHAQAQKCIYSSVERAMIKLHDNKLKLKKISYPAKVKIDFTYPDRTDRATYIPSVQRIGPLSIEFESTNFSELHKMIITLLYMTN